MLGYSSPVWSPSTVKDIVLLERIQRHATKYILNDTSDLSYKDRCITLNIWMALCYRREILDLCFMYSYLTGKISCDYSYYVQLVSSSSGLRSADNGLLLVKPFCKTVHYQSTYFNRITYILNKLPHEVRSTESMYLFKKKLNEFYHLELQNFFNIDNRCTYSISCGCHNCRGS